MCVYLREPRVTFMSCEPQDPTDGHVPCKVKEPGALEQFLVVGSRLFKMGGKWGSGQQVVVDFH